MNIPWWPANNWGRGIESIWNLGTSLEMITSNLFSFLSTCLLKRRYNTSLHACRWPTNRPNPGNLTSQISWYAFLPSSDPPTHACLLSFPPSPLSPSCICISPSHWHPYIEIFFLHASYDMRRMGSLNYFHCTQVVDCPSLHLTSELFLCMSSSLTIGPTHKLIHIYLPPPVSPFLLYMYLHPPYIYIPQVLYMRRTDLGSRDTDLPTQPSAHIDPSPKNLAFYLLHIHSQRFSYILSIVILACRCLLN